MRTYQKLNYDVLFAIFEYLQDDSPETLAGLARVCRLFPEPALDALWSNLDGLRPLLTLFPTSLVETPRPEGCALLDDDEDPPAGEGMFFSLVLLRTPTDIEWARFACYSRRVRSLIYDEEQDKIDPQFLSYITAHAIQTKTFLLPHLRILQWCQPLISTTLLVCFISNALETISITLDGIAHGMWFPREPDPNIVYLLEDIHSQSPYVRKMVLNEQFQGLSLEHLARFRSLRRLHLTPVPVSLVSPRTLRAMAELRTLELLSTALANSTHGEAQVYRSGFPSLKDLTLLFSGGDCHCHVDSLLASIESPALRYLTLGWQDFSGDIIGCRLSLQALATRWTLTLTHLNIVSIGRDSVISDIYNGMMDFLTPLLPLRRLRSLIVYVGHSMETRSFNLLDGDLKLIAEAWPELELLKLGAFYAYMHHAPSISSLIHFARNCPSLHTLWLPAACVYSEEMNPGTWPGVHHGLRNLHIHETATFRGYEDAPREATVPVAARFLAHIFPMLDCAEPEEPCVIDHLCNWTEIVTELRRLHGLGDDQS